MFKELQVVHGRRKLPYRSPSKFPLASPSATIGTLPFFPLSALLLLLP